MDLVGDTERYAAGQFDAGLGDSVARFAAVAAAGGFAVRPSGGQALLDIIDEFKQWMSEVKYMVQQISQRPPLGRLAGGVTMSPFLEEVATDSNGFATRFQELADSLGRVEEAIIQAMANYQATESENGELLDRVGRSTG